MKINYNEDTEIQLPRKQLYLYGYENYFNSFIKNYEKNKLPNSILLSGLKGLGKATFAYHFANYLLSQKEEGEYSVKTFSINGNNISYKLLNANTHPNFFLIESNFQERDIKIEQIRKLINFLNKTSYKKNLKIVMIDNAEYLNLNSSNALLKSIEEPQDNTFFFIIHNSASKILDTIKSRCREFKFSFTLMQKKNILTKIINLYRNEFQTNSIMEDFYFDSPGNLLKYFLSLDKANINIKENLLNCIIHFMEEYKINKSLETLTFITLFIQKFYNELCLKDNKNFIYYITNQSQILRQINNIKKFNLDEKNVFIWVKNILHNEKK